MSTTLDYGQLFKQELETQCAAIREFVLHSGTDTYDDYRYSIGKLHGIEAAIGTFELMREKERKDLGDE